MQTQPTPGYKPQTEVNQSVGQFIQSQRKVLQEMITILLRAYAAECDRSDKEAELDFRNEHGKPLSMEDSDMMLKILRDGEEEVVRMRLCEYTSKAHELIEGMQAYESIPVTAHCLKG